MQPSTTSPDSAAAPRDWSVRIEQSGRYGTITYRDAGGSIPMSWEFGGNDVVAIIYFEHEPAWRSRYPWAADRRAEIVQRVADDTIRQKAPDCSAEIDLPSGWINLRQGTATSPVPLPRSSRPLSSPAPHSVFRERRTKLMSTLAVIILVLGVAAVGLKSLFSVRAAAGTPLGLSVRTPEHIATLIQSLEPYLPSLHRNPDNDRYQLAMLLTPQDGHSQGKIISLAKHLLAQEFNLVKLLGCDGTTVWFNLNGIGGVNLQSGRLVGEADLRRANPALDESWDDQRRMEFDQRLRITSADRRQVYEVTPETLQAIPAGPRTVKSPFDPTPQDFLSSGVRPSPAEWLGLYSPKAAAGEYKTGAWLGRLNRADDAKEMRRLYRSSLGPELDRGNREILSQERVSEEEYFNAAFVRTGPEAEPLRLSDPESFLMIYTSSPGLNGTLVLARMDQMGKTLWKTDTGLDRFKLAQILPDARFIAFTGTRLPVPNKVSEPILVIVDTQSGAASTVSLWQ